MTHIKWMLGAALVLAGGVAVFWTRAEVSSSPILGPEQRSTRQKLDSRNRSLEPDCSPRTHTFGF